MGCSAITGGGAVGEAGVFGAANVATAGDGRLVMVARLQILKRSRGGKALLVLGLTASEVAIPRCGAAVVN